MKKKKKLPVFVLVKRNVLGKDLLKYTDQTQTTKGEKILKTKLYDCELDCNGVRIELVKK